ncbi:conserved hypothetical protein [groundwater metagenome]|uniref:Uncharacterized protein n=1 Tax=groundwater metagenome TaxID=717931 RepID=A0A098E8A4_9ZZZZ
MLDEYKRNGELFLFSIKQEDKNKNKNIDDLIKENFRKPVLELVGHTAIGDHSSEKDILMAVGQQYKGGYFEVSSKSHEILRASFFKTRKGVCSFCGKTTDVFSNRAYIFPFERKIDSISPEDKRLQFCKECGFTLYCGMASLYAKCYKENIKFFFDSYNQKNLWTINNLFKNSELRDPNHYNKIKNFKFFTYHPYETLFVIIFEFVNKLKEKNLINELKNIDDVKLLLILGSGQIYETHIISKLNKFIELFSKIIDNSKERYSKIENKERLNLDGDHLVFNGFFDKLIVGQSNEEKSRLRNLFVKNLLEEKIDFIVLNEIIMERVKNKEKYPLPFYYRDFLNLYMRIFKMETEQQMFERINGLGWTIGKKIEDTNLDSFVWKIFRARGLEEFYNVLVELQARLMMNMDLRPINEYEKEWRKAKAILLNGILNARYIKK